MQTTANEEILNYWNSLRGARPAPLRSELDPSALRHFLPHLFIVSTTAPGQLTFALAGTRLCELFDRELRGFDFRSVWSESAADRPLEIAENILLYERPALLDVQLLPEGEPYPYDLLMMPVRSGSHGSDRILGALMPRPTAIPDLMIPVRSMNLENWAFIEEDGMLPQITTAAVPAAREPDGLFRRLMGVGLFAQAGR